MKSRMSLLQVSLWNVAVLSVQEAGRINKEYPETVRPVNPAEMRKLSDGPSTSQPKGDSERARQKPK